ncbi:deoxynucleotidyltransferase terminal-interacting protein 2 [Boleophthalmus pectinirostris]|uniref:deoxynucleotidyltransferase terminal-interacting protein 2 n=1 Tax=Boleophthalmus pectinirostris TaxID=150288 RepID=UPI000A1C600B|nr:deoxynucleotidyltransferase terminal-interacting protein 2 [Boleophthalmus pectinirostris]
MVVTRRGVRVSSPSKSDSDATSAAQATPSTGRRTRRTANLPESPTQTTVEEASAQLEKLAQNTTAQNSARKRCTRASRLHSPDKPCTPVGSVHEGEISDMDSCCSALSDTEAPVSRKSVRRQLRGVTKEEDASEVESCSSVVSAAKVRRSTRKKPIPEAVDSPSKVKGDKTKPEPCTPVVSQRSKRTRTANRQTTEESEMSDADSITGDVATRRSTRSRRKPDTQLNLDKNLESGQTPAPTIRRTRATRARPESASEPMSCDSEGFESGPTYSRATRGRRKSIPLLIDSDSDLTDVGRAETPSSSRTGSGSSNQRESALAKSPKKLSVVLEKTVIPPDEEDSMNDSRLESTVIEKDAECTLIEEEDANQADETPLQKSTAEESSINSHTEPIPAADKPAEMTGDQDKPAVTREDHQEELPTESIVDKASKMEIIQETDETQEPSKPVQSASITTACDSQTTDVEDEDMEVADTNRDISGNDKQEDGNKDVKMPEGDAVESSSVNREESVRQIEEEQAEPIQGTSSQQHQTPEEQFSKQPPQGAVVQSTSAITLLDSSEDEDDDDDFADEIRESSGDEEEGLENNEKYHPRKTEVTKAVDGLFMIDTRPGQEADEQYYKERLGEEDQTAQEVDEEEEDEFVDEEGDDDYDDAADVLFSSRGPQVKALSSRIDPGIRMKELGGLYISFDGSKSKPVSSSQQKPKEKKIQDEVMKKSVIGPDFEKKDTVPPYKESKQALKLKRRAERVKTTGDAWFNMKAPEITQELKGDLQLLRMRGSMDPKQFYKKNDRDGFPKYFQMGTVVDNPVDFYHSRISKKDRKRTMVEELLADAEFRQKNKKKFQVIMAEKAARAAGRRHKMKSKFHKK